MAENSFFNKSNKMFEKHLQYEEKEIIQITDVQSGEILDINYDFIVFDSELNFYKKITPISNNINLNPPMYSLEKVDNPQFKAVVIKV